MSNLNQDQRNALYIGVTTILLCITVAYQSFFVGIPYLTKKIAEIIPLSMVKSLDDISLESLDNDILYPSNINVKRQQELIQIFQDLVNKHSEAEREYTLIFRSWNNTANALALPYGTIILSDNLVEIAENNHQIIAVLLHEIAHVEQNHGIKDLISSSLLMVSISFALGDISTIGDLLAQGAILGIETKYSRDIEIQSDSFSANILLTEYGDTTSLPEILTLISQQSELPETGNNWLNSHPNLESRINNIKVQTKKVFELR
jgi:Zn-dependent protease with chaperone function